MATKFVKGQEVKVNTVVPAGPVQKLRMDEDGNLFYMLEWADVDGQAQERWFKESDLIEA